MLFGTWRRTPSATAFEKASQISDVGPPREADISMSGLSTPVFPLLVLGARAIDASAYSLGRSSSRVGS